MQAIPSSFPLPPPPFEKLVETSFVPPKLIAALRTPKDVLGRDKMDTNDDGVNNNNDGEDGMTAAERAVYRATQASAKRAAMHPLQNVEEGLLPPNLAVAKNAPLLSGPKFSKEPINKALKTITANSAAALLSLMASSINPSMPKGGEGKCLLLCREDIEASMTQPTGSLPKCASPFCTPELFLSSPLPPHFPQLTAFTAMIPRHITRSYTTFGDTRALPAKGFCVPCLANVLITCNQGMMVSPQTNAFFFPYITTDMDKPGELAKGDYMKSCAGNTWLPMLFASMFYPEIVTINNTQVTRLRIRAEFLFSPYAPITSIRVCNSKLILEMNPEVKSSTDLLRECIQDAHKKVAIERAQAHTIFSIPGAPTSTHIFDETEAFAWVVCPFMNTLCLQLKYGMPNTINHATGIPVSSQWAAEAVTEAISYFSTTCGIDVAACRLPRPGDPGYLVFTGCLLSVGYVSGVAKRKGYNLADNSTVRFYLDRFRLLIVWLFRHDVNSIHDPEAFIRACPNIDPSVIREAIAESNKQSNVPSDASFLLHAIAQYGQSPSALNQVPPETAAYFARALPIATAALKNRDRIDTNPFLPDEYAAIIMNALLAVGAATAENQVHHVPDSILTAKYHVNPRVAQASHSILFDLLRAVGCVPSNDISHVLGDFSTAWAWVQAQPEKAQLLLSDPSYPYYFFFRNNVVAEASYTALWRLFTTVPCGWAMTARERIANKVPLPGDTRIAASDDDNAVSTYTIAYTILLRIDLFSSLIGSLQMALARQNTDCLEFMLSMLEMQLIRRGNTHTFSETNGPNAMFSDPVLASTFRLTGDDTNPVGPFVQMQELGQVGSETPDLFMSQMQMARKIMETKPMSISETRLIATHDLVVPEVNRIINTSQLSVNRGGGRVQDGTTGGGNTGGGGSGGGARAKPKSKSMPKKGKGRRPKIRVNSEGVVSSDFDDFDDEINADEINDMLEDGELQEENELNEDLNDIVDDLEALGIDSGNVQNPDGSDPSSLGQDGDNGGINVLDQFYKNARLSSQREISPLVNGPIPTEVVDEDLSKVSDSYIHHAALRLVSSNQLIPSIGKSPLAGTNPIVAQIVDKLFEQIVSRPTLSSLQPAVVPVASNNIVRKINENGGMAVVLNEFVNNANALPVVEEILSDVKLFSDTKFRSSPIIQALKHARIGLYSSIQTLMTIEQAVPSRLDDNYFCGPVWLVRPCDDRIASTGLSNLDTIGEDAIPSEDDLPAIPPDHIFYSLLHARATSMNKNSRMAHTVNNGDTPASLLRFFQFLVMLVPTPCSGRDSRDDFNELLADNDCLVHMIKVFRVHMLGTFRGAIYNPSISAAMCILHQSMPSKARALFSENQHTVRALLREYLINNLSPTLASFMCNYWPTFGIVRLNTRCYAEMLRSEVAYTNRVLESCKIVDKIQLIMARGVQKPGSRGGGSVSGNIMWLSENRDPRPDERTGGIVIRGYPEKMLGKIRSILRYSAIAKLSDMPFFVGPFAAEKLRMIESTGFDIYQPIPEDIETRPPQNMYEKTLRDVACLRKLVETPTPVTIEPIAESMKEWVYWSAELIVPGTPIPYKWFELVGMDRFTVLVLFCIEYIIASNIRLSVCSCITKKLPESECSLLRLAIERLFHHYLVIPVALDEDSRVDIEKGIVQRLKIDPEHVKSVDGDLAKLMIPSCYSYMFCKCCAANGTAVVPATNAPDIHPNHQYDPVTKEPKCFNIDRDTVIQTNIRTMKTSHAKESIEAYNSVGVVIRSHMQKYGPEAPLDPRLIKAYTMHLKAARHDLTKPARKGIQEQKTIPCASVPMSHFDMRGYMYERYTPMLTMPIDIRLCRCGLPSISTSDRHGYNGFNCGFHNVFERSLLSAYVCEICTSTFKKASEPLYGAYNTPGANVVTSLSGCKIRNPAKETSGGRGASGAKSRAARKTDRRNEARLAFANSLNAESYMDTDVSSVSGGKRSRGDAKDSASGPPAIKEEGGDGEDEDGDEEDEAYDFAESLANEYVAEQLQKITINDDAVEAETGAAEAGTVPIDGAIQEYVEEDVKSVFNTAVGATQSKEARERLYPPFVKVLFDDKRCCARPCYFCTSCLPIRLRHGISDLIETYGIDVLPEVIAAIRKYHSVRQENINLF